MDSSKVKNIIIILLLLVNLLLLGVGVSDRVREMAVWRDSLRRTEQVLSENGIAVSKDARLRDESLQVKTVSRSLTQEEKNVSAVLGRVTVVDQGGNRMFYDGEKGQAVFRGTGGFEMLMNEGEVPVGRDAENTAREFLEKMGIRTAEGRSANDVEDGSGTVVLMCESGGTKVLNCTVTFTFTNGSLLLAVGTWPLETAASGDASSVDVPTALMRFMASASEKGRVCNEVQGMEMCCVQTASASGTGELTPVWRIDTDAGSFYINAMTGREESVT